MSFELQELGTNSTLPEDLLKGAGFLSVHEANDWVLGFLVLIISVQAFSEVYAFKALG